MRVVRPAQERHCWRPVTAEYFDRAAAAAAAAAGGAGLDAAGAALPGGEGRPFASEVGDVRGAAELVADHRRDIATPLRALAATPAGARALGRLAAAARRGFAPYVAAARTQVDPEG